MWETVHKIHYNGIFHKTKIHYSGAFIMKSVIDLVLARQYSA